MICQNKLGRRIILPITINPGSKESKKEWMKRCMSNKEVRIAAEKRAKNSKHSVNTIAAGICHSQWRSK